MHKRVISFSLWGESPKYLIGAIENVKLAKEIYKDWEVWVYYGLNTSPKIISMLTAFSNCKLIPKEIEGNWSGMFWRFEPAWDSSVDVVISRDCDSRLSLREKYAVDEWLASDKAFHIMRDHPWHNVEILGGLWGVKNPALKDMGIFLNKFEKGNYWQVDQEFLKTIIYPLIKNDCLVHDAFFNYEIDKRDFPKKRKSFGFVGESFDENNQRNNNHLIVLKEEIRKRKKHHLFFRKMDGYLKKIHKFMRNLSLIE